jgi:predicted GTPase
MLAGSSVADVSGGAVGSTPSNRSYDISHEDNNVYTFWDTAGLNEAENGTVSSHAAVQNLLDLVNEHGVNLLVYCIRPRLVNIIRVNYELFWKTICMEKVPVVLVVTGLEGRDDMDEWWREAQKPLKKMNMKFTGHACITSTKGRRGMHEMKYKESAEKVWKLVRDHSTRNPWSMTPGWSDKMTEEISKHPNIS